MAWFGLLTQAGTPEAIVQKIYQDTLKVLALPEVRQRLTDVGLAVVGNSPREFAAQIRDEIVKKGKIVRDTGAKPD